MKREIARLVANGLYREAMFLYAQHHSASLRPHRFTFPPLLKACGKLQSAPHAQILHTHVIKTGFFADVYSASALTAAYVKLCRLDDALKVFDEMPERCQASLNAVITGFLQNGYCREALRLFKHVGVGHGGFRLNSVTIATMLSSACESAKHGMEMHCLAVKLGVEGDVYVATSALTMYSSCGELVSAAKVFEEMPVKNVVSYNAFVSGLLQNGVYKAVLDVFKEMRARGGERPNSVTLVCVLSACGCLLDLRLGRQVQGLITKIETGLNGILGTAMLDMYFKCGCWQMAYSVFHELNENRDLFAWNTMIAGLMLNALSENAVELFERLESEGLEPDSVTWNSMISGFSKLGKGTEAFKYFTRMQSAGVVPSLKSVTSLLPACADLSALQCGKEVHGHAIRTCISNDLFISTALIDMYMKCGQSSWARRVFDWFREKPDDPAFWNAILSGYGRNGENESAFGIFEQMLDHKVQPNAATFNSLLSMCSHSGLVDKGWNVFRMMDRDFGLKPNPDHFGCMIDLLGRSGRLDEARELVQELSEPSASVFASLLGACESHLDSELGEQMALKLSELEPENTTPFVILSKIYAALGRWEDAEKVRGILNNKALRKPPGFSLLRLHKT